MAARFGFQFAATDATRPAFAGVNASLGGLVGASNRTQAAVNGMNAAVDRTRNQLGRTNVGLIQHRRMLQQVGFQAGDFAVQMAGGQNAMLAFTQQGSQMLQFFGPFGAVLGGLLAVFGSIAIAMTRSGASMESLIPIAGVLAPLFVTLGDAMQTVGFYAIETANLIVNNFDRILIAAGLVAGFFVTKWVVGFIASGRAVAFLTATLNGLRVILLRLPFIAIIALATELIYQFTRLVQGAGSFGEALDILKDVAIEVWDRIGLGAAAMGAAVSSAAWSIAAAFQQVWADVAGGANSAFKTVAGIWNSIAEATGGTSINLGAGDSWVAGLENSAGLAAEMADSFNSSANAYLDMATAPLDSWGRMSDALGKVNDKQIDVRDWFGKINDEAEGGGSGGKGKKAKTPAESYAEKWLKAVKDIGDGLSQHVGDGLMAIADRTKTVGEAFRDMATDIIKELYNILVVQRIVAAMSNAITGNGSPTGGILGGLLSFAGVNLLPQQAALPASNVAVPVGAVGRAMGGPVNAGRLYRVNENTQRGAEFFRPKQDGEMLRESDINGGRGVIVNQHINISTGVVETVRQEISSMLPRLKQAAIEGVMQERTRGGAMRRTFK